MSAGWRGWFVAALLYTRLRVQPRPKSMDFHDEENRQRPRRMIIRDHFRFIRLLYIDFHYYYQCKVEFEYICEQCSEILSAQEVLAIFEELLSDDDSAASNNRDTHDEDYVENVAQGENISSDDEEIDEIQCPTSQTEVK
ncbi:hypothetical protein TNCV_3546721 [Trichonephila clavipes]|nr:hypothetical protein TNCV_3546721 [Trichonephila clavipes]